ncbi:MAG: family 78 glycoside hydrolase catalytic domain [Paenibacillaceae bacterium]
MADLQVSKLRCEYRENPIGIDVRQPRLSWQIVSEQRNILQAAYQIQVSKDVVSFDTLVWDTGKVNSDQALHLIYEGEELQSSTRYYYRVMIWNQHGLASEWSEIAFWEVGLLNSNEWLADWITPSTEAIDPNLESEFLLRKSFEVHGYIRSVRIYATSLGLYELELNGARVGDMLFTPGWTSYKHRLQYQAYDVTEMLHKGTNTIGMSLANGWFKGNLGWKDQVNIYGDQRAGLMQMIICYEDGSEEIIKTDSSWQSSLGPIRYSELYHGEHYDARLEQAGWSTNIFDATEWQAVEVIEHTKDIIIAQENQPTRIVEEINPFELIHTPAGEVVIDMGQNMVGWMRFSVEATAGTRIVLQHAEVLDKEGNFYTANLRSAKQTIEFISKGNGMESFEPSFSFQGFRYVKVEGYPGTLKLDQFIGKVIHTDMEPTGSFECSNPMINQLQHNIIWGQKGNFLDVPTDCPQRDERLGWTGDAQVFMKTAAFNYNVAPFFEKWLKDLSADQLKNGAVPFVVPHALGDNEFSSAAWGDAAVICPWNIYLAYGDKRILETQYDSMKAWVEYIREQGDNEYLWNTGFHFGDWLGLDAKENSYKGSTPEDLIATAFFAYSTSLLRKIAAVLGKQEDVGKYANLLEGIIMNFNLEFITPNGRMVAPTQTGHVLALMFDLVDQATRQRLAGTLAQYVKENKYHLTTGFVGTPYLCHVLSSNGYHDVAVKLVQQEEYPSWLYSVSQGATTIWEHWDGIKPDGSFWSEDMNSFNHYAYGAIGDWLYQEVAGLNTDEEHPGYKHMIIKPNIESGLTHAVTTHESMYGMILSGWSISENGQVKVTVTIPPNTTATVKLPAASLEKVRESGNLLAAAIGVEHYEQANGLVCLHVGSGKYQFEY